ncbi:nucleopolyhedrovirus P10 family protein [Streptomyces sp. NPDC096012]|uniref:nucleopolyhedrovirus P10 family protein n=1 Tax=Streptomyces sp. NPDC096012 TaxID=3155684 RepID=UPI00336A8B82
MTADSWRDAVRRQVALGRLVPLGGPGDGAWIAESAAVAVLGRAVAEGAPRVRLGALRIALDDPQEVPESVVPAPPGALPPGALRLTADFAVTTASTAPVDFVESAGSAGAAALAGPAGDTEPADPAGAAGLTRPADPAGAAGLTRPADPAGAADLAEPADLAGPEGPTEPADIAGAVGSAVAAAEPLPAVAARLRLTLAAAADQRLGLAVTAVDLRVTDLLEADDATGPAVRAQRPTPAREVTDAQEARVAAATLSVPGVVALTGVLGGLGRPVRLEERTTQAALPHRHVRIELAASADHRTVDVARRVRAAVRDALEDRPTVAVLVTSVS